MAAGKSPHVVDRKEGAVAMISREFLGQALHVLLGADPVALHYIEETLNALSRHLHSPGDETSLLPLILTDGLSRKQSPHKLDRDLILLVELGNQIRSPSITSRRR